MSEPEPIGDILPGVMADIEQRMAATRQRQAGVVRATGDFLARNARGNRQTGRHQRRPAERDGLFENTETGATEER